MIEQASRTLSNQVIGDADRPRLLVIDDEETIRIALSRFLRGRGYDVDTAASGEDALTLTADHRYSVAICDVRMPGLSGIQLIPKLREKIPDLAIMMLTAVNDAPTAAESLALGAMEYLLKPIELNELQQAVSRVLHRRSLESEQRNVERLIASEVERRLEAVQRQRQEATAGALDAIASLIALSESKDSYLVGTSARVAALARAIAEELAWSAGECDEVSVAARIHDVGRMSLSEVILNKPGPLSPDEMDHVRQHVAVGVGILSRVPFLGSILDSVRDHHERWDGRGYPRGIAGEEIAPGARVLSAADAFVALTSRRAYRPAMTPDDTVDYLAAHSGTMLEPAVYQALRTVILERRVMGLTAD